MSRKILSLSAIAMLLISMLAVFTVKASPGPRIYLEDPYGPGGQYIFDTNNVTSKFNVTVWVENTEAFNIMMFQVYLIFDPQYINITTFVGGVTGNPAAVRAWPNDDLGARAWDDDYIFKGKAGGAIGNPIYDDSIAPLAAVQIGDLIAAQTLIPADTPKILCRIEFEVQKYPPKGEGSFFDCDLSINNDLTYVYDSSGEIPGTTKEDGYYKLTWAVPPPVTPAVSPTHVEYGPWPPKAIGETFLVDVYLNDLHPAWDITFAYIELNYNTTVIDVVGGIANVTVNPLWTSQSVAVVHGTPWDEVQITVGNPVPPAPGGDVLIATVNFTVMKQEECPPFPADYVDVSPLDICEVFLEDHTMEIPTNPPINGTVIIHALLTLPLPWFEIYPSSVTLGPEPAVGQEFEVQVKINELHFAWYAVAYQFVLHFDHTLLEFVEATEGPFFTSPRWNWYGTIGFMCYDDGEPWDISAGNMLNPNPSTLEWDQTELPNTVNTPLVNNTVAIFKFRAIKQLCDYNLTDLLWVNEFKIDGNPFMLMSKDGKVIMVDESKFVNCTYSMLGFMYPGGRWIDVYGGAVNRGYGVEYGTPAAFPAPYGGQGLNGNMDLVIPQSVVYLLANVSYNYWPVQSKDVGYEIDGPFYQEGWTPEQPVPRQAYFVRKYSNRTDDVGVAWLKFQMPWPCDNPEDLFGKYRVTVTVDICGEVVKDTLWFDYYYLIEIYKVTTNKYFYKHCEYVSVTIDFRSKAQQEYPVLFSVVIQDRLETHFGAALIETSVEGAKFCHWKNYTVSTSIHVIKWAFAGIAKIYVSAFDKDPTIGGAPWLPTFGMGWPLEATIPEIYILPE